MLSPVGSSWGVRESVAQARLRARRTDTFMDDGAEHAQAVAVRVEVAHAVDPGVLKAGDLGNSQPGGCDADVDQGFYLKAITPQPAGAVSG